jgi:hypothetical protein
VYYELLKPLKRVESPKTELELTAGRNLSDVRTVVVVTQISSRPTRKSGT